MNRVFDSQVVYKTVVFFVIWLLLTESYSLVHLSLGVVASAGVALLNTDPGRSTAVTIRWPRLFMYLPWLFGRMCISGLHLSFLILHPKLPIAPALIRYRTKLGHKSGIVLLGNSLTLTPGTVTVEAQDDELVVHGMDEESLQDLNSLRLEREVAKVFKVRKGPT